MTLNFYDPEQLTDSCRQALTRMGVEDDDALEVAKSLVLADTRGLASHGVSRMAIYMERLKTGKMEPVTRVDVLREAPSTLLLDGNNGLGVPVALRGMELVSRKAKKTGIAFATIRRSNHFGMAGHVAEAAVKHGLIGYASSNGAPRMPAYGAQKPVFGTSPFACAVPTGEGLPIIVDMATCVVARGKIIMAARAGENIPEGWALDEDGQPTTDPHAALKGSVLPFGGPKGSAIALLIEVFAGVLGGDTWGRGIQDLYDADAGPSGTSHTLMAIDLESFIGRQEFETNIGDLVEQMKDTPLYENSPVYFPGEREQMAEAHALREGVLLAPDVVDELNALFIPLDIAPLAPKHKEMAEQ